MKKKAKIKKGGFTLIELLTTIAIIGILTSALFVSIDPKEKVDSAKDKKVLHELSEARTQSGEFWSDNNFSFEGVCTNIVDLAFGGDCQDNIDSWAKTGIFSNNSKCCADSDGYIGTERTEIAEYSGEFLCASNDGDDGGDDNSEEGNGDDEGDNDGEDDEGGEGGGGDGGDDDEGGDGGDDEALDCSGSAFPMMCCGTVFSSDLCNMTPGCHWGWFMCSPS